MNKYEGMITYQSEDRAFHVKFLFYLIEIINRKENYSIVNTLKSCYN